MENLILYEKGILFVATGNAYIAEAIIAAKSCRKYNPYPIAIITDSSDHELPLGLFDMVIYKPALFNYQDKLLMRHSPFEKTIFLDTDVYVAEPLDDLFKLLDYREFAIHQSDEGYEFEMPEVSNAMPEFNTGVIAFRLTPAVLQLIEDWNCSFAQRLDIRFDQFHLRKTLYESDVKYAIFSSAYNFIIYYPNFVIQTVKIVHGRPAELLSQIAADINRIRHDNAWRRMFFPYNNKYALIYANLRTPDILKLFRFHARALVSNCYRQLKKVVGKT
jgi:hypothetical protein